MATQLKFSNLPDSELCVAAIDYARNVSEPALFHHVMRSAVFADAIGRQLKMKFDREVLCVAAVLHDLGLTKLAAVQTRFELEGADAAKEFLVKRGMSEGDIETVWEAIALHTTAEIPSRRSPEVALCQMGIAIDLFALPPDLMTAWPHFRAVSRRRNLTVSSPPVTGLPQSAFATAQLYCCYPDSDSALAMWPDFALLISTGRPAPYMLRGRADAK
jgi:hypothetical protein